MKCKKILCLGMAAALAFSGLPGTVVSAQEIQMQEVSPKGEGTTADGYSYEEQEDGTLEITGYSGTDTELNILSIIDSKTVTSIGWRAFDSCSSLNSIKIPASVTSIGDYAFSDCSSLSSIEIPNSVTSIGGGAFSGCSKLSSIEIPGSVTSIGGGAFSYCDSLENITVDEGNKAFSSVDGVLYDKEKTTLIRCPGGKTQVSISDGVTSIGESVFSGCSKLSSVKIPSSVTSIEEGAFSYCDSLENITVDEGNKAFSSVDGVLYDKGKTTVICCPGGKTQVSISNGVTSIGGSAFSGCSKLSSVEIPGSLTSIGELVFYPCGSLKMITVDEGNQALSSVDGVLYNKEKTTVIYCPRGKTQVSIPDGVTSIGDSAFCDCSSLSSIELPGSLSNIGRWAFARCRSLSSIKLPSGVPYIWDHTFFDCSSLSSIEIPESVTGIGEDAFARCNLKDVYYGGSEEQWKKVNHSWFGDAIRGETVIHYNYSSTSSQQPGTSDGGTSDQQPGTSEPTQQPQTPQKSDQTITAKNITKTYGAKPFSLNAKANTGTALTYAVSDKKVATIDKKGKVTIKGCGITNITITAPATDAYNQAKKTIKLTVKPKKVTLSSVKSTKKKTATVKWKQDKKASGYLIQCATDSKFKKNKVQVTVSKNKTVSATVKKLKAGKKYYVRVCAYAKSGKTKVQGDWSKVKTVKVKK